MRPRLRILLVSLVIAGILIPLSADPVFLPSALASHQMAKFRSYDEMIGFIKTQPSVCDSGNAPRPQPIVTPLALGPDNKFALVTASGSTGYSTTNVQVQGVDELDTVKTEGQYIYTITNNTLVIVRANPADAGVVAKISNDAYLSGVFVYGDSLVLIGGPNSSPYQIMMYKSSIGMMPSSYYWFSPATSLWVYDISNISSPTLTFSLKENGTYVGSRLINNSVYLITTQYANLHNETVTLPARLVNGQLETTQPTEIYHSDVLDNGYSFTTVSRIILSQTPSENSESFLISSSGSLYVSMENIYLTSTIWSCNQETVIHRVDISNNGISYEATGTVHGQVMNQFSMDEYQGFFRVATTTWPYVPFRAVPVLANAGVGVATPGTQVQSTPIGPTTNVYVLNMDLHNVGSVEGISPGETFYAARFFGDRAYLVTFQRVDPLFVVDLKDPYRPQVIGQLEITGVSDYLQPYDKNHLIGFGKSSVNVTWENAALFQGLKFSLFDVTDPTHPIDTSDFLVGDRGSDSLALTDSHAVLFARDLNLLVVPVEIAQISGTPTSQWESGAPVWQGAYVFTISPSGIVFRGGITHLSSGELPSYSNSDHFVTRSLYIGNVLYTISPAMVKMNSLTDLSDIGSVTL